MKLYLKLLGSCAVAAAMVACQGSSKVSGFDPSAIKGSWQATYIKDSSTGSESKDDGKGFLTMVSPKADTPPAPHTKSFLSFDGSKVVYTTIDRNSGTISEDTRDYHLDGNIVVSKVKAEDGTVKESKVRLTKLTHDLIEMVQENGSVGKFRRVTQADVMSAKTLAAQQQPQSEQNQMAEVVITAPRPTNPLTVSTAAPQSQVPKK